MIYRLLFMVLFSFSSVYGQGPTPKSDEFPFASLEEAGFNRDSIQTLLGLIDETTHKDFRGLVVLKDHHVVIEEYYNTFWVNTIHDIRSAGKSITALLLGVAMQDGLIKSLDQSVYSLFSAEKNPKINPDYKKIKLRHLLDMASGLDADTDDADTPGHAIHWADSDDWKSYLLNVPLKSTPGQKFVYADIHALLIGLAIEEASGMSLRDYAQKKLFDPLNIKQVYWYTNEANQTGAAGNLYLSTLDFAKLGLLVANGGTWEGQPLISQTYIDALIGSKNLSLDGWFFMADTYGMFWYKATRTFGKNQLDFLFASGLGGNHLVVVPEKKIVIALTSSAYGQRYQHGRSYEITKRVLRALE